MAIPHVPVFLGSEGSRGGYWVSKFTKIIFLILFSNKNLQIKHHFICIPSFWKSIFWSYFYPNATDQWYEIELHLNYFKKKSMQIPLLLSFVLQNKKYLAAISIFYIGYTRISMTNST